MVRKILGAYSIIASGNIKISNVNSGNMSVLYC